MISVPPAAGPLSATVQVPGSKSVANRMLICAALADGVSRIENVAPGDDTAAMLDCIGLLGARVDADGAAVTIAGTGGDIIPEQVTLPTRLAGTTSRFITAVAALGSGRYTVDGLPPLRARPMTTLHDALTHLGATVTPGAERGHLPVTVTGPVSAANATVRVQGDVSSQYITALMLIAPYLPDGLRIELTTELVSRSYLRITAAVMAMFGVTEVEFGERTVTVAPGRYDGTTVAVEPDASSASYPLAAAAIVGGSVTVPGLTADSLQGDARFAELLGEMGCDIGRDERATTISRQGPLSGIDVDMSDISDLVPTVAVVGAFADSRTTISGVGFIRHKESDRIGDLVAELRKAGVDATETEDGLVVEPSRARSALLGTHHDHRLAMAFGLLGLGGAGIEIDDPDVVTKSWPAYWSMLESLS